MKLEDIQNLKSLIPVLEGIINRANNEIYKDFDGKLIGHTNGYKIYKTNIETLIDVINNFK